MSDDEQRGFGIIAMHAPNARKVDIPLDNLPEHAEALGRLLGHWAYLEVKLSDVLGCLLFTRRDKARMVWQEFVGTRAKITLLQRLNWQCIEDEEIKRELDSLLSTASELNVIRNKYVHALWSHPGNHSEKLTRTSSSPPGNYKKATKEEAFLLSADIVADADRIAELSVRVDNWERGFTAKYGFPPEQ